MLLSSHRCQALPLYGHLLIQDPAVSTDLEDLPQALSEAGTSIIGAGHQRIAIHAGQDSAAIEVQLELWDEQPTRTPGSDWQKSRRLKITFPGGALAVENISAGPVALQPGGIDHLDLPGGPGLFHVAAWYRGREAAAAGVNALWEADEADNDIAAQYAEFAGIEAYRLQIWHV